MAEQTDYRQLLIDLGIDKQPERLVDALTHASFSYENGGPNWNKLRFLGEGVLELPLREHLYKLPGPELSEVQMSQIANRWRETKSLAHTARRINLGRYLKLGVGEESTGGRNKDRNLAEALEAVFAAIHIDPDLGLEAMKATVFRIHSHVLQGIHTAERPRNWKGELREWANNLGFSLSYKTTEAGPPHRPIFSHNYPRRRRDRDGGDLAQEV